VTSDAPRDPRPHLRPDLRPAVFLDRDGVINENVDGDYVRSWEGFRFLPGSLDAIARLTRAGFPVVIVTNQQGVGKGLMRAAEVESIHERMLAAIRAAGGAIAAVRYCPHLESDACDCRKPMPGLLTAAAAELGLNLARSVFVGDAVSDVEAARAAGCRPVLVLTGRGAQAAEIFTARGESVEVAADLAAAVDLLLGAD
jgi:D-glycero-D-manno-heptose 1,7-bisphosphate phosphatase